MTIDRETPFTDVLTSVDDLRTLYRAPLRAIAEKKLPRIEPWGRAFVEASPFALIAITDPDGRATVSPKGGRAGFITVLDEHRLAIPDYAGNNLIDSLRNIVANPRVGIICLIPGRGETLRVDGRAWVTTQPEVIAACAAEGRSPKTVIGVEVEEMFLHCSSSFSRGDLWTPATWRDDASSTFIEFIRSALPPHELPEWAVTDDQ